MRYAIDTAPMDGKVVILEDDASGTYDVAHWSVEAGNWIGEDGEPSKITPTHWYAMPGDKYVLPEDSGVGPSESRTRNHSFLRLFNIFRFSSNRSAPRRPTAASGVIARRPVANAAPMNAAVEAQTAPAKAKRAPHARRRFAAFSITASIIGAVLVGMYLFRAEIATQYAGYLGYLEIARSGTTGVNVVDQESQLRQDSQKADSVARDLAALQQQAEADRATSLAAALEAAQVKQAAEASALDAQSLEKERRRAETLASELAETRRTIDARNLQLLGLERKLAIARREIDTHAAVSSKAADEAAQLKQAAERATEKLQQSVRQEHDRAEALARDLATARREIDTHAALSIKASDEAAQLKQAAESATEKLQQSVQQERAKAEALARELATARREIDTHAALSIKASDEAAQLKRAAESATEKLQQSVQQERAKAEALARDLATARREIDTHTAVSSKAADESAQLRQVAVRATADMQQSLQQERARAEALARDLATARREIETHAALSSKAGDEAAQLKQAAESTTEKLQQSVQQERAKAEALARELELARRTPDPRIALQPAASTPIVQVAAAEQNTAAEAQSSPEAARLIARASALLSQGNIGAARIVLERAAETGSAQASFTLAETYDPVILSTWGTYGTRGDTTKARELYANAYAGGIQEAKDRFNALRQ